MTSPAIFDNKPVTMTSLEIADLVDSSHDKVKQSIERLAATVDGKGNQKAPVIALPPMGEVSNTGFGPRTISVYHLCKRDSLIAVAQLCPEFTAKIVDRWQELEGQAATGFKVPTTLSAALRLAADQADTIEAQQAKLAITTPKAEALDRITLSDGTEKTVEQVLVTTKGPAKLAQVVGAGGQGGLFGGEAQA